MAGAAKPATSVIATLKNAGQSVRARAGVSMREEIYSAASLATPAGIAAAFRAVQRHVDEVSRALRMLPILGGAYWPNVSFTSSTPQTIAHGLGDNTTVTFLVLRPRANGAVWETGQKLAAGTITLESSATMLVDLWFFPQPSGVR